MTFDSSEEAEKIAAIYPDAELVLRIAVEDTDAPCPMTKKFGAPLELWDEILDSCIRLKTNLVGVSFHVGSGGCSPDVYRTSLEGAHSIFEKVVSLGMPPLTLLDIGGGFSQPWSCNNEWTVTNTKNSFEVVAPQVRQFITNIFPETNGPNATVRVIGEPGRFICQSAVSLCTRIFLKKKQRECTHYFVDSGVYQALPCHNYDGEFFRAEPMIDDRKEFAKRIRQSETSFVWGQTCDGIDWLMKDQVFPALEHGDWLMYRGIGAYNQVVQCQFNGYNTPTVFYM